jgi:predicted XRE-type DNA-binding protein
MSAGYVFPVDPSDLARFSYEDPRFDEEDEDLDEELEGDQSLASYIPDGDYESRIAPLLDRIPDREADLIYLYFIEKKRQADIATIFGVTQAAISYRLDRGIQRLKFLLSIPQMTEEELRNDLPEIFPTKSECANCDNHVREKLAKSDGFAKASPRLVLTSGGLQELVDPPTSNCLICLGSKSIYIDVEILVGMWATTCQSEVASKLGLTQGRVRHRFFKAVQTLEDMARIQEKYLPYQQIFSAVASKRFNILREVRLPQWADRGGDECF